MGLPVAVVLQGRTEFRDRGGLWGLQEQQERGVTWDGRVKRVKRAPAASQGQRVTQVLRHLVVLAAWGRKGLLASRSWGREVHLGRGGRGGPQVRRVLVVCQEKSQDMVRGDVLVCQVQWGSLA